MELRAEGGAADGDGGDLAAVVGDRGDRAWVRGPKLIAVDEVEGRLVRKLLEQRRPMLDADRVPADVRDSQRRDLEPDHPTLDQAQPRVLAVLLARLGEQLHSQADAENRPSGSDQSGERVGESALVEAAHPGAERANSRQDQPFRPLRGDGIGDELGVELEEGEGVHHRSQVSHAVVDDADHGPSFARQFACYGRASMSDGARTALEDMWAGEFGDAYLQRNNQAARGREPFWKDRIEQTEPASVLEVGCNLGGNLRPLAELLPDATIAGVDVNDAALEVAREAVPGAQLQKASAYALPFDDRSFDLVFTTGVLIHLPPEGIGAAIDEIVRCSKRYVLCGEYYADEEEEVPYRGQSGALFRRDYGEIYGQRHPELNLLDTGFLPRSEDSSWDDVTWWLLERA